jgi:hypothetical protein
MGNIRIVIPENTFFTSSLYEEFIKSEEYTDWESKSWLGKSYTDFRNSWMIDRLYKSSIILYRLEYYYKNNGWFFDLFFNSEKDKMLFTLKFL